LQEFNLLKKIIVFFAFIFFVFFINEPIVKGTQRINSIFNWKMFSGPLLETYDLSWDQGQSFLFRDYSDIAPKRGVLVHPLFSLVQVKEFEKLNTYYKPQLKKICQCESVVVYRLDNSMYEHIFGKSRPTNLVKVFEVSL